MARRKKGSIIASPKHGANLSVLRCICCGKDYGIALLGKLKGDEKAPKEMYRGLCNDCGGVINQGGVMIIEVKDGEQKRNDNNPYRTGRIVGVSKDFKERNHIESPIVYMEESVFSEVFGEVEFNKD